MRQICLVCPLLLLLLIVRMQAHSQPCSDPNTTVIDTMMAQATFETATATVSTLWEVAVERNSAGQTNYRIDVASIRFIGNDSTINAIPTTMLFDMIGRATVSLGVTRGYTPCPVQCDVPSAARVAEQGCVTRNGSGAGTRFQACENAGCCYRYYTVCCPNGAVSPVVTLSRTEGPTCSNMGSCQPTCP